MRKTKTDTNPTQEYRDAYKALEDYCKADAQASLSLKKLAEKYAQRADLSYGKIQEIRRQIDPSSYTGKVPNISGSGGHCCGQSHIHDMYPIVSNPDKFHELLAEHTRELDEIFTENYENDWGDRVDDETPWEDRTFSHMLECVVTDEQIQDSDGRIVTELVKAGFHFRCRWLNDKSDNYCNLFVHFTCPETSSLEPSEYIRGLIEGAAS